MNSVNIIGRLTRDPEMKTAASGVMIAKVGFAVNNRKKNSSTGQWENDPCFIDCVAFGKTAEIIGNHLHKGSEAAISGKLQLETWTAQDGGKRSKHSIIIDNVTLIGSGRARDAEPAATDPIGEPAKSDDDIPF